MKRLDEFAGSVAVLVSSCDAFFDCWRPFAFFFRKFWGDCPFPVYLIVNELRIRSHLLHSIAVGQDRGWASNMQTALRQIHQPYVLYFQEDYFLTAPVDREQLAADITFAFEQRADSLCFCDLSLLEPEFAQTTDRFGAVPPGSTGRTRLQVTLWKRDMLAAALRPGETAWEMEAQGSARTRAMSIFSYARASAPPFSYLKSGIVRGLWTPEAVALCRAHNFQIQPLFRPRLVDGRWRRRWRRAVGRIGQAIALARQRREPVNLDS